jgi:hypothetical protein
MALCPLTRTSDCLGQEPEKSDYFDMEKGRFVKWQKSVAVCDGKIPPSQTATPSQKDIGSCVANVHGHVTDAHALD